MKKVIIYGISFLESRLKIEGMLDDCAEIIGYMDSFWDKYGAARNEFEYLPVIALKDLKRITYDYIVINAIRNSHIEEITQTLTEHGAQEKKIIPFYWFSFIGLCSPIDKYLKLPDKSFEGILMGMSYAKDGFYPMYFDRKFFNFSARGMDLHYHYHTLKRVFAYMEGHPKLYEELKYIVFELPYYIFNYDVSKEASLLKYRMSQISSTGSWHHALEPEEGKTLRAQWEAYIELFGKKLSRQETIYTGNPFSREIRRQPDEPEKRFEAFYSLKEENIAENERIWRDTIQLIYRFKKDIKVAVVIFPQSDRCQEWGGVKSVRDMFYEIIMDTTRNFPNINVFDYFTIYYGHREYFYDYSHLNVQGAGEFSKHLNGEFTKWYYE